MVLDMTRFVARFLAEARGHLAAMNGGLLALERDCRDPETIQDLFVRAHTIKGTAGMLKLREIAETADHLEEALSALREGEIACSDQLIDLFLSAVAAISVQLDGVPAGAPFAEPDRALCAALARAAAGAAVAASSEVAGEGDRLSKAAKKTAGDDPPAPR
jgi:two-component system, chemotaxis family, sensor kinase CheA